MSIHCWLILQIGRRDAKRARAALNGADVALDRAVVHYGAHRFAGFAALSDEDRSAALEDALGDAALRLIKDPRGVCVQAEVGQSFDGRGYTEIAAEAGNLFVPIAVDALAPSPSAGGDPVETAIDAILAWVGKNRTRHPVTARKLNDALLFARWSELAEAARSVPDLVAHAKVVLSGKSGTSGNPKAALPADLAAFFLEGAIVTYVDDGPGSRARQRGYPSLRDGVFGDDFDDLFARVIDRAALGDARRRICIAQYHTSLAVDVALVAMRAAFAGFATEVHRLKLSTVFAIFGQCGTSRALVRYSAEVDPARVDLIWIGERP